MSTVLELMAGCWIRRRRPSSERSIWSRSRGRKRCPLTSERTAIMSPRAWLLNEASAEPTVMKARWTGESGMCPSYSGFFSACLVSRVKVEEEEEEDGEAAAPLAACAD